MPKYEIKNVEGLENIKQYSDMAAMRISPSLMAINKEEFDSRKKGAQVSFEDFDKYRNADTIVIKCTQIKKIPSSTFSIHYKMKVIKISANDQLVVESGAFCDCPLLETVKFKSALNKIKNSAFTKCNKLKTVIFEKPFKKISGGAFSSCKHIESLVFNELSDSSKVEVHAFPKIPLDEITLGPTTALTASRAAILTNLSQTKVQVCGEPSAAPSDSSGAAISAADLVRRESTTSEGRTSNIDFNDDESLPVVKEGNLYIDEYKFAIPESVRDKIYEDDLEILKQTDPNEAARIKDMRNRLQQRQIRSAIAIQDDWKTAKKLVFGGSVRYIGNFTFMRNLEQLEFEVGSRVERISEGAFKNCKNLKYVYIPKSIKLIEDGAFSGCTSLETVYIDSSKRPITIKQRAFSGCSSLKKLTIPIKFDFLASDAFKDCSSLKRENIRIIGIPESDDFAQDKCRIPILQQVDPKAAERISIEIEEKAAKDASDRGFVILDIEKENPERKRAVFEKVERLEIVGAKVPNLPGSYVFESLKEVRLKNAIELGEFCLCDCAAGKPSFKVVLPNTLQKIGKYALAHFTEDLTIPKSVKEIVENGLKPQENPVTITFEGKLPSKLDRNFLDLKSGGKVTIHLPAYKEVPEELSDYAKNPNVTIVTA